MTTPTNPKPLWQPSLQRVESSAMTAFRLHVNKAFSLNLQNYAQLYQWSITCVPEFWQTLWTFAEITCSQSANAVVQDMDQFPGVKWFPGARINFAENLLWRRDDKFALVSVLENGYRETYTYQALFAAVEKTATALKAAGVQAGDRVAGFMPNVSETVIAMLATTSIGAVWSSCSPDFGIAGAVDRLGQIEPKVLFVCDGYFYNDKVIDCSEKINAVVDAITTLTQVVVVPVLGKNGQPAALQDVADDRYIAFDAFIHNQSAQPLVFEQLPFDHPLYILYSSGTTGKPKCIVHGAGGTLLQHKKEMLLHVDLQSDDTLFYFTTCGWMMWNWMVSALSLGSTVVIYDGSPFAAKGEFLLDMIDKESITIFGCGAKYIAGLEKAEIKPRETHDLSSLKTILSTGSPLSDNSFEYIYRDFKTDVCLSSICGGTDIVSCFILGNPTLPVYTGEIQCLGLGMAVEFWDQAGESLVAEKGELVCTKPFPSAPLGFWNDPDNKRFLSSYFDAYPNVWAHGDYGELTPHGGIVIHGRSDAVLNPGGVRIGTAEIYRQVETFQEIADCIAVGQQWQDDERVILFVVLNGNAQLSTDLIDALKLAIKNNATPRHVPAKIIAVPDIPKTISGKIVEVAVKHVIHGRPVKNIDALANPEALNYFKNLEVLSV